MKKIKKIGTTYTADMVSIKILELFWESFVLKKTELVISGINDIIDKINKEIGKK
jgi:hypothetical protein